MRTTTKTVAVFQIIGVFILPILLVRLGIIPIWYRFIILGIVVAIVAAIMISERWTASDAGIRFVNASKGGIPYIFFTIVTVMGLLLYEKILSVEPARPPVGYGVAVLLSISLSTAQEFLFRSFLIPKLLFLLRSPFLVVIVDGLLFSFLHILYPDFATLFPIAFIGGLGFAAMYIAFPNLFLISASHAVLNFATALLGFFVIPSI